MHCPWWCIQRHRRLLCKQMKRDGVPRNTWDYFTLSTKPQDRTRQIKNTRAILKETKRDYQIKT